MAEQTDPPSLSALTRESNRWCNSEVVGTRRTHQGSQKRGPQRSPAGRRPERRALPEEAEPAPAKRARRTTRNQQPGSSTPHDSPVFKRQRNSRRNSRRDSISYNYNVPDDCVARCTRSRSALKPDSSEPQGGRVAACKSYNFSYLNRANHTFDVATPSSSSQLSFNNQVEGALFPLDERDFAYSPFSSSTITDLIDSDYSVYTPTSSRSRCRKRKRSSKARLKLSKKRNRHSRKSFEETHSKEIKIESRKSNLPSSSKSRSGESQRRRSLTPGSEASGSREPGPRRSLIPRLVGCAYPLRNRHNTSAPSTSKTRDGSVSSTASEASSQRAPSCLRNSSGGRSRKSSTPPLPKGAADSGYKSQSSPKNKLVIVPRDLPYLRQTDARRSIAAASGCNLGKCLSRGAAASSRQRRDTTDKRQWAGSSGTGCGGWRRRGARPADMPQQNTHHTTNNAKRDKKGKSSLGSCASSGGGAGGSAARRQLQQHAADQQPPVSTSAAVASTSSNHNQQQAAATNMTGGQNIEMKSKGKAPPSNAAGSGGGADDCGGGGGGGAAGGESSSEEGEVGRLQALLEARGLPPHLLGALGPRMQHLLHRTMGASTSASKATQLVAGLQASGDEGQQLQAVIELCQLLVMGNEDTLAGFPVRQAVPALLTLLAMDHNFDMMNHACRALTYMMEALPRSSGAVALAVPAFLEKLQAITCMDVAEQSLTALDMLSRRHSKAILQARGVSACLMYLDFFSINAQRAALSITANCCQNLTAEEFHFVRDSLQLLANRLTQQDKKSVESVCLAFSRLVDSYQNDPARLQEITTPELLTNLQQLLVVSPPLVSTGTFMTVIRMLTMLCAACPALAVALHQRSIADTLLYLLTGSTVPQHAHQIELVERSPQELYEITSLVAELMPSLPPDPLFAVDAHLDRPGTHTDNAVQWQWRDDRGVWRSYTWAECRVLETAHAAAEEEVTLAALGRSYTVDLHAMQQVNEDTGTARPVQRTVALAAPATHPVDGVDERVACVREAGGAFVRSLLAVLLEVYSSSAGPAVRAACLKAMLRMLYYASAQLLRDVLKFQVISSQIAGMMASNDLRIVVGSLQLAEILMQKLPDEFGVHFRREGVMHQVNQLADPMVPLGASPPKVPPVPRPAAPSAKHTAALVAPTTTRMKSKGSVNVSSSRSSFPVGVAYHVASPAASTSGAALDVQHHQPVAISFSANSSFANSGMSMESLLSSASNGSTAGIDPATGATLPIPIPHHSDVPLNHRSQSPVAMHFGDILKRKRAVKRTPGGGGAAGARHAARRAARHDDAPSSSPPPHQSHAAHHAHSSSSRSRLSGATSKTSSFLSSLHPSRWGRQLAHGGAGYSGAAPGSGKDAGGALAKTHSNANLTSQNSSPELEAPSTSQGNLEIPEIKEDTMSPREKARSWVRAQAARFVRGYAGGAEGVVHAALGALARLTAALRLVPAAAPADHAAALLQLRDTVLHADLSSFEVNHSGLIGALLHFLTYSGSDDLAEDPPSEELQARDQRLRLFLNIFAEMPLSADAPEPLLSGNTSALSVLVSKVNACVSQLEQFPVRVHDLPARPATSALKFFNTHQLMCDLKRHPNCTNLKQWKGGVVRIDPLALVQAIERYLAMRGYAVPRGGKEAGGPAAGAHAAPAAAPDSDDDNASDDDIDDTLAAVIAQGDRSEHKLEFLIGDAVLPYNMTVYQAVRQYSAQASDQSETDTDTEAPLGNAGIWVQTHTIYYRSVESPEGAAGSGSGPGATGQTSGRKGKGSGTKSNPRRKTDDLWNDGMVPQRMSALHPLLRARLPSQVTVTDASLPALALLRALHALSRHWSCLYSAPCHQISRMLLPAADFINAKLAAKASRQLQDPLVIMTGNLPQWLQQIAYVCPFVLPFECRHLLFYVVSFDRERALQRLLEAGGERAGATGADERVAPRLDRRKRTVARSNLLRQAEQLMHEYAHSKALLEVQYENEVGTGLGPTLEFYALVSLELQRADLDLWHGSENFKQKPSSFGGDIVKSHQAVIVNDANDSPPPITITDPTANLASSVYNNLNLTEEQNRNNTNQNDNFESFDMPMIVDTSDVNLNESQQGRKETATPGERPSEVTYVNWPCGLFPQAIGRNTKASQLSRIKAKFRFLGKFMAKAVMDSRMLDMPLSVSFYRWVVGEERCLSLADVRGVSPELWRSLCRLQQVAVQAMRLHNDHALSPERRREMISSLELDGCPIEELGLDFILPGRGCTELRRGGRDTPVTAHNLNNYIQLVAYWMLNEGVNRQLEAFREGFESVFPLSNLKVFYPEELELIFCGSPTGGTSYQKWEVRTLAEWCRPDHGYTAESRAIRWLLEILASYDRQEQRLFLQFVTGSPRLPTGGFKALTPPLTVVRKTLEANVNPDDYLPSVMTCVNYLKLPDYSSQEVMRHKLRVAASEGQHSFHLS